MSNKLLTDILNDMRVELADEFDRNFSEGGFFGKRWQRRADGADSHLIETGKLRRSLRGRVQGNSVVFVSSEPYAALHNEGGRLVVTKKMRRYFWAKYYAAGKKGKQANRFKALALKKVGSSIRIPQRQFVGDSPQVRACIESIIRAQVDKHAQQITKQLKQTK